MRASPTLLALSIAMTLAAAGCQRDPGEPTLPEPPVAAPQAEQAPASAVTAVVDQGSPLGNNTEFDAKAFAGTYGGTIPCADCPGIDMSLAFTPEGKYTQTMAYQERNTSSTAEGTWTLDADGRRIHLDPTSKDDADSWVQVMGPGAVRMLDAEGKPITGNGNYTLSRR